ncbi:hypothetical protein [Tychonema bourrellyi]|nr:hypothetical protein [Tychonema bourrellyi]
MHFQGTLADCRTGILPVVVAVNSLKTCTSKVRWRTVEQASCLWWWQSIH